jgi:hypothetical protein
MNNDLAQIELSIDTAKKMVKEAEMIDRLLKNRDFKAIILDGYYKEFAAILVQSKAMPAMQTDAHQLEIEHSIVGIGQLQQYLFAKRMQGKEVGDTLNEMETVREELIQEEANGGE